jgi:hypothetical protein
MLIFTVIKMPSKDINPRFAKINIPNTSPASIFTQQKYKFAFGL